MEDNYYMAYTGEQIDKSVTDSHTHVNKSDIDQFSYSSCEANVQKFTQTGTDLQTHKDNDNLRWQEVTRLRNEVYDLRAGIENKILDTDNAIDIESESQGSGYHVVNTLGGRVKFTGVVVLIDIVPKSVSVNGSKVWDSGGLGIGTVGDSIDVQYDDIITCTGLTAITFTPYISGIGG